MHMQNSKCTLPEIDKTFAASIFPEYIRQLAWYDSLLREDDYVLGATIYQASIHKQMLV